MKNKTFIIIAIVLIGLLIYLSINRRTVKTEDVFEGTITNMELAPQTLSGVGVYDRSCNMIGGGLTQCDAGIQTEKGVLNFNYKHNMAILPCIDEGQNLEVEILEGGKAKVRRMR